MVVSSSCQNAEQASCLVLCDRDPIVPKTVDRLPSFSANEIYEIGGRKYIQRINGKKTETYCITKTENIYIDIGYIKGQMYVKFRDIMKDLIGVQNANKLLTQKVSDEWIKDVAATI